ARSLEMVVGLLGILKAGGAYVPLDPDYPQGRLSFMLVDSQVGVLLTQHHLHARLPKLTAQVVYLDEPISSQQLENPPYRSKAEHWAYMIYTSGSTGKPKGAINTHRAISNRLLWMQAYYGLTCEDRVLHKTPFSFDVSVWELFWPLITGAPLIVALPEGHRDSQYLWQLIAQQRVTTVHFVPSMLYAFLDAAALFSNQLPKRIICSGEALSYELQQRCLSQLPHTELYNLYGPTEAAVDVTYWHCRADSTYTTIPIGRPIANTQIYILDPQLQPTPIGVAGELCIAGVQVGYGYFNRPELTEEKFIEAELFGTKQRLYKTGDLARWLADGMIEYLGRIDHQIKLRGFRIELGEIEAVLLQLPQVREVVAVIQGEESEHKRLVAYVVADETVQPPALREFLRTQLPEYMLPAQFVQLPELPLTPNGKIDRRALPLPEHPVAQEHPVLPSTPTEAILATLWQALLKVQAVSIHDNFFELGGHSLLATQLMVRIQQAFSVTLSIRQLFEAPTIAALATQIEAARRLEQIQPQHTLKPIARSEDLPLSFGQQRLWFLDQLLPDNCFYHIATGLELQGAVALEVLERSVNELIRRHETLRTVFIAQADAVEQRIQAPFALSIPLIDLTTLALTEQKLQVQQLAAQEAQKPFQLEHGPLLRLTLLKCAPTNYILLLTIHHIIADGWSIKLFFQELFTCYQALLTAQTPPLAPLAIQYADFAYWQRQWLSDTVLNRQLSYWQQQLAQMPPLLELPVDRPRPAVQTHHGSRVYFHLDSNLVKALEQLSQRHNSTLFVTLLSAWVTVLFRYSGQHDIAVGYPMAQRTQVALESLIGFLVNTLILRVQVQPQQSFEALLSQIHQVLLDAYDHQDIPFEKLVEVLQPERDMSHMPLVQVTFSFENMPIPAVHPEGLTIKPFEFDSQIARFDLEGYVWELEEGLEGCWVYNT
ncbi:MAG: amino acid adenylation domain-containing protein, partial [Pseudomonadota bacterium]|nr:amino acid adenylation domain-containing protein [Pseudomonadota bacterium]